ncbi:MAG: hypothetical protein HYY84_16000 [Deltaproteobacteria bacterium]|nr:hypothetical protein [Deltaproteobacteria bacterium]
MGALVSFCAACPSARRNEPVDRVASAIVAVGVSAASPLSVARSHHTATLLFDGRILVCGGYTSIGFTTDACEIIDPATSQVVPVAGMSDGGSNCSPGDRAGHTATLLPDGRVLVTGGVQENGGTPDWITGPCRYDPVANQWTSVPAFTTGRAFHIASLLNSEGDVIIVGGQTASNSYTGTCRRYLHDGGVGSRFDLPCGALTQTRGYHAAFAFDGGVYVVGGVGASAAYRDTWEVYMDGGWTLGGTTMPDGGRASLVVEPRGDGTVMVFGGHNATTTFATGFMFDPGMGTFSPEQPVLGEDAGRTGHTMNRSPTTDDTIVVGGDVFPFEDGGAGIGSVVALAADGDAGRTTATPRYAHQSVLVNVADAGGPALVVIGGRSAGVSLASVEVMCLDNLAARRCAVGGRCVAAASTNPTSVCQICDIDAGGYVALPDGTGCATTEFCRVNLTCTGGLCDGGVPRDCSGVADECNDGACDEVNDVCVKVPKIDAGAACADAGSDAGADGDAGSDAGSGTDAGTDGDAGSDAGAGADDDAGVVADAGAVGDAGTGADAGSDAGAGAGADAGVRGFSPLPSCASCSSTLGDGGGALIWISNALIFLSLRRRRRR